MSSAVFLMVIASAFLHASWNFTAKKVSGNLSVIYLGSWFATLLCLPVAILQPFDPEAFYKAVPFMVLTGLMTAAYLMVLSKAYKFGDISVVYPIARGSGVAWTALIAFFFLKENFSFFSGMGIFLICLGTVMLGYRGVFSRENYRDILFALLIGIIASGSYIIDKLAVSLINPVIYIFFMFFLSSLFLTPFMLRNYRTELRFAWKELKKFSLIIGAGSMGTYLIILYAFTMAQVSYVIAVREVAVVIGSYLGIRFLKESFNIRKAAGIFSILSGLLVIKILN